MLASCFLLGGPSPSIRFHQGLGQFISDLPLRTSVASPKAMWVYTAWCQWWLYLERWLLCSNLVFLHAIPFLMRVRFGHVPGARMTFFPCWSLSVFQFSSGEYSDHCYYILPFVILTCTILCPATATQSLALLCSLSLLPQAQIGSLSHPQVLPCMTQSVFLDCGRKAR